MGKTTPATPEVQGGFHLCAKSLPGLSRLLHSEFDAGSRNANFHSSAIYFHPAVFAAGKPSERAVTADIRVPSRRYESLRTYHMAAAVRARHSYLVELREALFDLPFSRGHG